MPGDLRPEAIVRPEDDRVVLLEQHRLPVEEARGEDADEAGEVLRSSIAAVVCEDGVHRPPYAGSLPLRIAA